MWVYKITNTQNKKIYIGITTTSIKKRWSGHLTQARIGNPRPLYKAIRKYGENIFIIEPIYYATSVEHLGIMERFYIHYYNSLIPNGYNLSAGGEKNQLDGNPRAKLKTKDVFNIREIYNSLTMSCSECYEIYKNKISFSAFEKIWEGQTWNGIHMEVYTQHNKKYHSEKWKIKSGELNGNGKSDLIIIKARLYYVTHSLTKTYFKYGKEYSSQDSFRQALNYSYLHLPVYKKTLQKWFLNTKEININTWLKSNPVSTISVSGE